jgi:hypothetical protein
MFDRIRRLLADRPTPLKDAAERLAIKAAVLVVAGGALAGVVAVIVFKMFGG